MNKPQFSYNISMLVTLPSCEDPDLLIGQINAAIGAIIESHKATRDSEEILLRHVDGEELEDLIDRSVLVDPCPFDKEYFPNMEEFMGTIEEWGQTKVTVVDGDDNAYDLEHASIKEFM